MSLRSRIVNVFRRDRLNREIEEELQTHLDEAIETGRKTVEARQALGSRMLISERSRDLRIAGWLDSVRADAIFGWRQILKRKATSAAAILSLALAIGSCGAAFRLIDALLLRPLPVKAPERLYSVAFEGPSAASGKSMQYDSCSYPMFQQMREAVKQQAELMAASYTSLSDVTYASDQEMEKANVEYVSGWMFDTLGIGPAIGRVLSARDDGTPGSTPYAVLSYDYWTRRFARDPNIVGRNVRIGTDVFQVVGVAQKPFTGTETGFVTSIFIPMAMKNARILSSLNNFWMRTVLQLKPGVTPEPVEQRLRAVFRSIQEERIKGFPAQSQRDRDRFFQERLLLVSASAGRSNMQRDFGQALLSLGLLVALVLIIACANVANLMAASAAARAREMALRVSIGAGRGRLIQLVLIESALLAFLATAIGACLAWWSAPFIVQRINPANYPAQLVLPADWRVVTFGLALACFVTFLFGLAPALRASSVKPVSALRGGEDPHSRHRLIYILIAAQVAFCFVVQFAAGLFVSTFEKLAHQPLGFSAERILNLETVTPRPQPVAYWNQVADHLRGLPGVEMVSLIGWPLLSGESNTANVSIDGAPVGNVFSDIVYISPGWVDTMKVRFLSGHDFRPTDTYPSTAIVNQAFAKQYFNGADPLGKSYEIVQPAGGRARVQIVGYVGDARSRDSLRQAIRPTAYVPFQGMNAAGDFLPKARGTFVLRALNANPLAMAAMLRQEVPRARSEFRVSNIETQEDLNRSTTLRERLLAMLASFFAVVALLLASVGLYGVLDFSVQQRRREIGIRIAIGARAANVARLVTAQVLAAVAFGAVAGIALGATTVRFIESLLFDAKGLDVSMLSLPAVTIFATALLVSLPAVARAVRIDPVTMLRSE